MSDNSQNNSFSSNLGAILAAVGSAVGLGNIWRFPYICGKYGGGAFLLIYIIFVVVLGFTMMLSEFTIGRRTRQTPSKALPMLVPKHKGWRFVGYFDVLAAFVTLCVYWVISGWTANYFVDACSGTMTSLGLDAAVVKAHFNGFVSSVWPPIVFAAIFATVSMVIIMGGVRKGIEAVSKVLMPVLVVLLVILCVYSLTLPGASKGLSYLLVPDFSKINAEAILAALGQALFSLSVGIGMMIVYGGYLPKDDNLMTTTIWIALSDSLIAVLAGIAIFPAVFTSGMEPAEGAGLVFKVLPIVFNAMGNVGQFVAIAFFLLLIVAALTSAISVLEYLCAWLSELSRCRRVVSAVICTVVTIAVAALLSLSNGVLGNVAIGGRTLFELFDLISGTYLFPICALAMAIFFGWAMPVEDIRDEISNHGSIAVPLFRVYMFLMRYVIPVALLVVLVSGIWNR